MRTVEVISVYYFLTISSGTESTFYLIHSKQTNKILCANASDSKQTYPGPYIVCAHGSRKMYHNEAFVTDVATHFMDFSSAG